MNIARNTITNPQIKKIYTVTKQQGIDSDLLHSMIYERFSKSSIRELSKEQAIVLISSISKTKKKRRPVWLEAGPISLAQTNKVQFLLADILSKKDYKKEDLLKRILGKSSIDELNTKEASKFIYALEKISKGI